MNYIAAGITPDYWPEKTANWLESVLTNRPFGWEVILFCVDFMPEIAWHGFHVVRVNREDVKTFTPGWCQNRPDFLSLEGGDFLEHFDFHDSNLVIFTNVDVTLQRKFTTRELETVYSLGKQEMALQYDAFPPLELYDPHYITSPEVWAVCDKADPGMVVHNVGVMVGRVSAWKRLYSEFVGLYNAVKLFPPRHHAISQWVINYILQVNGNLSRLPNGFHEAHWWTGNEVEFKDGQYRLFDKVVLFAHHKFHRIPHYGKEA